MKYINSKLILVKVLLFTFYGAIGCLMPFLTLHMAKLGLASNEITSINSILPLLTLMGPPLVGYIADRMGCYKVIIIISMVLAGVFYTLLLFVPSTRKLGTEIPFIKLHCDLNGASLSMDSCGYQCRSQFEYLQTKFRFKNCRRVCTDLPDVLKQTKHLNKLDTGPDRKTRASSSPSSSPRPIHMCFNHRMEMPKNCQVINSSDDVIDIYRSVHKYEKHTINNSEICIYPQESYNTDTNEYTNLTCDSGVDYCHVECDAFEVTNTTAILRPPKCMEENSQVTFWVYLVLRAIADNFPAILIALLDAVVLTMVSQHGGDFGRQLMFGLVSVGVFAPLAGYLIEMGFGVFGDYDYGPMFFVYDILLIITAFLTLKLPISIETHRASMLKNVYQLMSNKELALLIFVMILLGALWGYLETFLYIHLLKMNAPKYLIGLTVTIGILPSVPFLYKSDVVVKVCGFHYILITAFVVYTIRYAGYAYITNPWWALPLEALELFTQNLVNVASVLLAYKLAPTSLVATAQGLVWMAHYNIGGSIGIFIGGRLDEKYGTVTVFQGIAAWSAFVGAVYLSLYHLVKYHQKRQREYVAPLTQHDKTNGQLHNGNYKPLEIRTEDKF